MWRWGDWPSLTLVPSPDGFGMSPEPGSVLPKARLDAQHCA